ncbi:thioredoxin [Naviculisporaceae sp. PSN 640]
MPVHTIATEESFQETIKTHELVLVDFFATWCGPCKVISPAVEELSNRDKYKAVVHFAKIDVDVLSDLCDQLEVLAMPTFLLFKDGVKVASLVEPKPAALVELLDKQLPSVGV